MRPSFVVRVARALAAVLLRLHPPLIRDELGPELLDDLGRRVARRGRERGWPAAAALAARELVSLAGSAVEARRELSPGRIARPVGVGPGRVRAWPSPIADLAHALRAAARAPRHAMLVVTIAAATVGLGTAMFATVHRTLVAPLPFERSDDLVQLWAHRPWIDGSRVRLADDQIRVLRESATTLSEVSALWLVSGRILGGPHPIHTDVARTSAGFFRMLGVEPFLGRTFVDGEDQPGAPWVALLDYHFWQRELGGDPDVLGRKLVVGWPEMEIVGVLPPDFSFRMPTELGSHGRPDLWIPWWHAPNPTARARGGVLAAVGRIRPGATREDVASELDAIAAREDALWYGGRGFDLEAVPLRDSWTADARPALAVLAAAVLCLMLIGLSNVAALQAARTEYRLGQLALHRVLGASAARVTRLAIAEGFALVGAGAVVGGVLGIVGSRALLEALPTGLTAGLAPARLGPSVAFAVGASALLAWVAAAPVVRRAAASPTHPRATRPATRGARGRSVLRPRAALQVAVATVLLIASALLVRSFTTVTGQELGFRRSQTLTFSVYLMEEYETADAHTAFYDELRERIRAVDGVRAVSGTTALPLTGGTLVVPVSTERQDDGIDAGSLMVNEGISFLAADHATTGDDSVVLADLTAIQPRYFEAIGTPLVSGREFSPADDRSAGLGVVLDADVADRLWPGTDAVGRDVWVAGAWRRVVGTVARARLNGFRAVERPQVYLPQAQVRAGRVSMVVHADGDPLALGEAIRSAVESLDPMVPIADVRTTDAILDGAVVGDRVAALLMSLFGATSLLLVGLGLYGTLAADVSRRTRGIAVRLAMGADRGSVHAAVLGDGLAVAGLGLALGLPTAVVLGSLGAPLLHGVRGHDPAAIAVAVGAVLVVTLAAAWSPARRAGSVDPEAALRAD